MKAIVATAALTLACMASAAQAKVQYYYTISNSNVNAYLFGAADISGSFTTGTKPADFTSSISVTDYYPTTQTYSFSGSNFNNWKAPSQQFSGLTASLAIGPYTPVTGTYNASFEDGIIDYSGTVELTVRAAGTPEPAAWAMMLLGLGGLGAMLRRGRAQTAAA